MWKPGCWRYKSKIVCKNWIMFCPWEADSCQAVASHKNMAVVFRLLCIDAPAQIYYISSTASVASALTVRKKKKRSVADPGTQLLHNGINPISFLYRYRYHFKANCGVLTAMLRRRLYLSGAGPKFLIFTAFDCLITNKFETKFIEFLFDGLSKFNKVKANLSDINESIN